MGVISYKNAPGRFMQKIMKGNSNKRLVLYS